MWQRFPIVVSIVIGIAGREMDHTEWLVHEFLRQTELVDFLDTDGSFACCGPVFRRAHHTDTWIECLIAEPPPPNHEFCVQRLTDCSCALVCSVETVVLIDGFAACMDFNLLARWILLKPCIELFDEFALQRIKHVITHNSHDQNASEFFREDGLAIKNGVVDPRGGSREEEEDERNAYLTAENLFSRPFGHAYPDAQDSTNGQKERDDEQVWARKRVQDALENLVHR